MNELKLEATVDNLTEATEFIENNLAESDLSFMAVTGVCIAVEEIYVNIANYAYSPGTGDVTIRIDTQTDRSKVFITFEDHGIPYDPLEKEDPDISLSLEERQIGGLGIFMTKQFMDEIKYEYKDGRNILTLIKNID